MKRIRLEKELVLRLYYFTHQAMRSLHTRLEAPWHVFLEFYCSDRINALQELIAELRTLAGPPCRTLQFQDGAQICCQGDFWTSLLLRIGGFSLGRWKKTFAFHAEQIDYFGRKLESFVQVLDLPEKPQDLPYLISLRMALFDCCWMIQYHWRVDALAQRQGAD